MWTDGDGLWPTDYRLVDPAHGKAVTKNDLFRQMLRIARQRGLKPGCDSFDSWYSGKDNLKAIRELGWAFLTRVRCNRRVNLDRQGNRPIQELVTAAARTIVHLEGFGMVKAFRIVASNGRTEHWVTNDLEMGELARLQIAEQAWGIEKAQADYPSSRRWVGSRRIGYHRRDGVARTGRVVPGTPGRPRRRNRMSDTTRRPAPPRA